MSFEISATDLAFFTALLAFLAALGKWVLKPAYLFIYRLNVKLDRLDTEFANGHDVEADDYVGFRPYVEAEFEAIGARLQDGSDWMRDHEQSPATRAHGRVQPPR